MRDNRRESVRVLAVPVAAGSCKVKGHGLWTLNVTVTKTEI